ncbi:MAG TPA: hypothetical protein VL069_14225 [Opitutus sp.]|nr:hypothetical protein [Opitutus sp.]
MHSESGIAWKGRSWLGAILIGFMAVAVGRAADLSGIYADTGTRIASGVSAQSAEEPSLFALLKFEFVPEVVSMLRGQTASVKIVHADNQLEVVVYDLEGTEIWSALWTEGERYFRQGDRLILRSPPGRFGDDKVLLILEQVPEHGLLQVSVQRIVPTMFGPAARKLDAALFHLIP